MKAFFYLLLCLITTSIYGMEQPSVLKKFHDANSSWRTTNTTNQPNPNYRTLLKPNAFILYDNPKKYLAQSTQLLQKYRIDKAQQKKHIASTLKDEDYDKLIRNLYIIYAISQKLNRLKIDEELYKNYGFEPTLNEQQTKSIDKNQLKNITEIINSLWPDNAILKTIDLIIVDKNTGNKKITAASASLARFDAYFNLIHKLAIILLDDPKDTNALLDFANSTLTFYDSFDDNVDDNNKVKDILNDPTNITVHALNRLLEQIKLQPEKSKDLINSFDAFQKSINTLLKDRGLSISEIPELNNILSKLNDLINISKEFEVIPKPEEPIQETTKPEETKEPSATTQQEPSEIPPLEPATEQETKEAVETSIEEPAITKTVDLAQYKNILNKSDSIEELKNTLKELKSFESKQTNEMSKTLMQDLSRQFEFNIDVNNTLKDYQTLIDSAQDKQDLSFVMQKLKAEGNNITSPILSEGNKKLFEELQKNLENKIEKAPEKPAGEQAQKLNFFEKPTGPKGKKLPSMKIKNPEQVLLQQEIGALIDSWDSLTEKPKFIEGISQILSPIKNFADSNSKKLMPGQKDALQDLISKITNEAILLLSEQLENLKENAIKLEQYNEFDKNIDSFDKENQNYLNQTQKIKIDNLKLNANHAKLKLKGLLALNKSPINTEELTAVIEEIQEFLKQINTKKLYHSQLLELTLPLSNLTSELKTKRKLLAPETKADTEKQPQKSNLSPTDQIKSFEIIYEQLVKTPNAQEVTNLINQIESFKKSYKLDIMQGVKIAGVLNKLKALNQPKASTSKQEQSKKTININEQIQNLIDQSNTVKTYFEKTELAKNIKNFMSTASIPELQQKQLKNILKKLEANLPELLTTTELNAPVNETENRESHILLTEKLAGLSQKTL